MPSPLEALVSGYERGQQLHIQKAEKVAKEQSVKFQQQFEVEQAKQKAAYEKQQGEFERQRIAIENQAQERLKEKDKATEENNKIRNAIAKATLEFKANAAAAGLDEKKWKAAHDAYQKQLNLLLMQLPPVDALSMTDYLQSHASDAIVGPANQQGNIATAPAQGQPGIVDALSQAIGVSPHMQGRYGVQKPASAPDAIGQLLPLVDAKLKHIEQTTATSKANEELKKSQSLLLDDTRQTDEALKKATLDLKKAEVGKTVKSTDKIDEEIKQMKAKGPLTLSEMTARIAKLQVETDHLRLKDTIDKTNEDRKQAELIDTAGAGKVTPDKILKITKDSTDAQSKVREFNEHYIRIVKDMSLMNYNIHNVPPVDGKMFHSEAERDSYAKTQMQLYNGLRNQLTEMDAAKATVKANADRLKALADKYARKINKPSGEVDHRSNNAAMRAAGAAAAHSQRAAGAAQRRAEQHSIQHAAPPAPMRHAPSPTPTGDRIKAEHERLQKIKDLRKKYGLH